MTRENKWFEANEEYDMLPVVTVQGAQIKNNPYKNFCISATLAQICGKISDCIYYRNIC